MKELTCELIEEIGRKFVQLMFGEIWKLFLVFMVLENGKVVVLFLLIRRTQRQLTAAGASGS